jgi:Predicted esterase of the alpha-beta hydrolase superfamily
VAAFDGNLNIESVSAPRGDGQASNSLPATRLGLLSVTAEQSLGGGSTKQSVRKASEPSQLSAMAGDSLLAQIPKTVGATAHADDGKPQGLVSQFTGAALHSALQAPANGITQLIDGVAGTSIHDKVKANEWFAAPREAKFGSLDWHVQQVGSAVGMAADFIVLNKGLKSVARGLSAVSETGMPARAMTAFVNRPMLNATISGGMYDGLFRESASSENLLGSRLKQAGIGAATFATLSGTGSLMRSASEAGMLGKGIAQKVVGNQATIGFMAGIPAGVLNAELASGGKASFEDLYKAGYGFAFLGGTVGGVNAISGKLSRTAPAESETYSKSGSPAGSKSSGSDTAADARVNQNWSMQFSENSPMLTPSIFNKPRITLNGALEDGSSIFQVNGSFKQRLQDTASQLGVSPFVHIRKSIDKWWSRTVPIQVPERPTEVTLFLEGGGANGWRHIGVHRAIEEAGLKVGDVYTASIGTVIGALIAKGKTSAEIEQAFITEFQSPLVQSTLPKEPGLKAFTNRADPTAMINHWVEKYGLEPNDRLHIGTFYARERRLHWLEGTNYNIAEGIKASMNIPGVFSFHKFSRENLGLGHGKPVTLLDGGIRRVTADDLPKLNPIVISRLHTPESGFQYNAVNSRFFHWLGNALAKPLHRNLETPDGDAIVIYPKEGQVNAMAFNQPEAVNRALIKDGYETAKAALNQAMKEGRLSPTTPIFTFQLDQATWPDPNGFGWAALNRPVTNKTE